jgi:hypothetical protein
MVIGSGILSPERPHHHVPSKRNRRSKAILHAKASPEAEIALARLDEEVARRVASNAKQLLRMENPVRHAALMAQIVEDLIIKAEEDGAVELDEHLVWGVLHLGDMAKDLRSFYCSKDDEDEVDAS